MTNYSRSVLKSNGLPRPKIRLKKFGFSIKAVPANIVQKLSAHSLLKSVFFRISTSLTNGSRLLSQAKAGTHSAFRERSHTTAHTAKHGTFRMGALLLPSERSTRFGNPAWPGFKTANFAAFGAWSWVLPKNAESLRDSDALMRVAVPRRRGPAGLRDLFRFCRNCSLYALRSGPFRVCEAKGGITTLSALYVLLKRWTAACQKGSFAVF